MGGSGAALRKGWRSALCSGPDVADSISCVSRAWCLCGPENECEWQAHARYCRTNDEMPHRMTDIR